MPSPGPWSLADGGRYRMAPSVDMFQTENEVVVKAAVPGIKADDVQINVTGEVLTIKGETKEKSRGPGEGLSHPRAALGQV